MSLHCHEVNFIGDVFSVRPNSGGKLKAIMIGYWKAACVQRKKKNFPLAIEMKRNLWTFIDMRDEMNPVVHFQPS